MYKVNPKGPLSLGPPISYMDMVTPKTIKEFPRETINNDIDQFYIVPN